MRVIAVVRSELCGSDTASGVAGELAVDVGVGIDGDGAYLAVALVHSVAEDAQRNVVLLPRRLAADLSLHLDAELSDAAEIRAEGRVLLAELRGLNPRDWVNVALDGSLLLHSGP